MTDADTDVVRTPCCAPEIARIGIARLGPSDEETGEMQPDAAVAMSIKYRCSPFAPYPFNDPLMDAAISRGTDVYRSFYDGGGLPSPICDGSWQLQTIQAYRSFGSGTTLSPGWATVTVHLTIPDVAGPEGETYASGSATRTQRVYVLPTF